MEAIKEKGENSVRHTLQFVIFFVGIVSAISALSLAVSSKILLVGNAFIALAVWGKRKLKQERKP